jgi:L-malate glycosyltransferase
MNRPLRLLFIANPNSTHTRRWINWFFQRGHTVALVADNPLSAAWEGIQIFDLASQYNRRIIRYLIWQLKLRQIIRHWRPDILHAQRVSSAGWLGAFTNFHPFVVTPWGTDLYQHPVRSRIARELAWITLRQADLVTADSQDLCRQAISLGADPQRTKLAQWGVETKLFSPGEKSALWSERLKLVGGPVILSPRAVNRIYNLDTILMACARLKSTFPELIVLLRAYNADPEYKNELDEMARRNQLQDSIRWIGAIEPYPALVDIYRLADMAVSIPDSDGTPVSVLEAMACGIPVIASNLPSLQEWISDGQNGLLVPARDVDALTAAMTRLLSDNHLRVAFAEQNIRLIKTKAEHELEMMKIEALYQGLAG